MTPEEHARVMEYRRKHKRCRTCEYAIENGGMYWRCKIKNKAGNTGLVRYAGLSGVLCKVYKAKEVQDENH